MVDPDFGSGDDIDLSRIHIVNREVIAALAAGQGKQALDLAARQAVEALCDLALVKLVNGEIEQAVKQIEAVLGFQALSQHAIHNFVAIMLTAGLLRGANLEKLQEHLARHWHTQPWMQQYRPVLLAPRFLNLEFVNGKCNLKCRMCVGGHGKTEPRRLDYMTCDDFGRMLAAVPTIGGLTLSSGNSEPLLHPEFEQIIDLVAKHYVLTDIYTNGHPLNARKARKIVQSDVVGMVNFSLDAATPETYRRIRGADFHQVIQKIEMLRSMKDESKAERPLISLSFVAMADNIAELPAFVELAHRLGGTRVYVEDLIGWDSADSVNRPATEHPQCHDFVMEAMERAARLHIRLDAPERLHQGQAAKLVDEPGDTTSDATASSAAPEQAAPQLLRCGWLHGVWVQQDGRFDPCCLVHGIVDMGCVQDGPVLRNRKFARTKELLLDGQVFAECVDQRACAFVQQQKAAGVALRIIKPEKLGASASANAPDADEPSTQSDEAAEALLAIAGGDSAELEPFRPRR